jgi:hypothetical protein
VYSLPRNDNGKHIDTDLWEGFIKYAVEMDPVAVKYVLSFIKTGSAVQVNRVGYGDADT